MASTNQTLQDWKSVQNAHHRRQLINRIILTIITSMIMVIFLYPVYFWITASLRPTREIFTLPPPLLLKEPTSSYWSVVIGGRSKTIVEVRRTSPLLLVLQPKNVMRHILKARSVTL